MVDEEPTPTTIINLDISPARINTEARKMDDIEAQLLDMDLESNTLINVPELLQRASRVREDEPMPFATAIIQPHDISDIYNPDMYGERKRS